MAETVVTPTGLKEVRDIRTIGRQTAQTANTEIRHIPRVLANRLARHNVENEKATALAGTGAVAGSSMLAEEVENTTKARQRKPVLSLRWGARA